MPRTEEEFEALRAEVLMLAARADKWRLDAIRGALRAMEAYAGSDTPAEEMIEKILDFYDYMGRLDVSAAKAYVEEFEQLFGEQIGITVRMVANHREHVQAELEKLGCTFGAPKLEAVKGGPNAAA
jgi:hypothetical protein